MCILSSCLSFTQFNTIVCSQMHPYDRYFYNHTLHKYTVDRYLNDTEVQ